MHQPKIVLGSSLRVATAAQDGTNRPSREAYDTLPRSHVPRRKDAGSDAARNAGMFKVAREVLAAGGAILIFPEGVSQAEPVLMPLRTGAARMLLGAEAPGEGLEVTLLPVGLVYHEPGSFRAARAIVLVGDPVRTDDLSAVQRSDPERAARLLTDRLAEALRRLIVEAGDPETLRLP